MVCGRMRHLHASILAASALACLSAAERSDKDLIGEGLGKIEAYDPIYAIVEPHHPVRGGEDVHTNIKFQFSFAYPVITTRKSDGKDPRDDGFFLSYTQLSFWDLDAESKPFYDTSYKPEGWYHLGLGEQLGASFASLEFGYAHESNGRDGDASRSINRAFLRTNARWELGDDWYVLAHPRFSAYRNDVDNPQMSEYRGYVDLLVDVGKEGGFKAALWGRIGDTWEYGSLQADLSYALHNWWSSANGFLYFQSFVGYSETLLNYTAESWKPRFGIGYALVR